MSSGTLLPIIPEETLGSLRRMRAISAVEEVHDTTATTPQPSNTQEPSTTSTHQVNPQLSSPVAQASTSSVAFQRVTSEHEPITGGEKTSLVGYGFSEVQGLLVRFSDGTELISTELFYPQILQCIFQPSHSAQRRSIENMDLRYNTREMTFCIRGCR